MQMRIEPSPMVTAFKEFIANPNYLTGSNYCFLLRKNRDHSQEHSDWILNYLRQRNASGDKVPQEAVHLIFILLATANLSVNREVEPNVHQIMERVGRIDPKNCFHADLLWNFLAAGVFAARSSSFSVKIPEQWQALIPNYANLNKIQLGAYCIGQALIINTKNTDAWLHLASIFNNLALELSDLPPELIPLFKQAISDDLSPLHCALFCCNQVLQQKHNDDLYKLACGLKTRIEAKLNATPMPSQNLPMSGLPASVPLHSSMGHSMPSLSMFQRAPQPMFQPVTMAMNVIPRQPIPEAITPAPTIRDNQNNVLNELIKRARGFKITTGHADITTIFTEDLTIPDARKAINSAADLVKILEAVGSKSKRHYLIYALFTHSSHTTQNSFKSMRDDEFIMKIIKTKEDFEKIFATLPADTPTSRVASTARNKYLQSPYISSLFPKQAAQNNQPSIVANPAHVPNTLFAPRHVTGIIPLNLPYNLFAPRLVTGVIPLNLPFMPEEQNNQPPKVTNPALVPNTLFAHRPAPSNASPVLDAIAVEFIELNEETDERMEIETVPNVRVKRERESDEEQRDTKKPRL